jgi:outer membrane protein OmpA-like peptidoglycan-associated protein
MFGAESTRLGLFSTIGIAPSERYDVQLHTGFTQNDSAVVGDQIFGDFVDVSLLGRVHAGPASFMLGVLGNIVTADAPESTSVERAGVEIEAGSRLQHNGLFVDAGGAFGPLDNGLTPLWRAQVTLGVTGIFDHTDRDRDQDGVPDQDDVCQHVAEDLDGFEDDDGCPEADNDGDGIADAWDRCPTTAEDFDQVADSDGCPEDDEDADAIADSDDACPEAAEDFDGFEDDDGCPESGVAGVADRQRRAPETSDSYAIYFDTDLAVLTLTAMEQLRQIASIALDTGRGLHIVGHADERGDSALNATLSEQRANAARGALIEAGVSPDRITMSGEGSSQPIAPSTEFGLTLNRRVTFEWVD